MILTKIYATILVVSLGVVTLCAAKSDAREWRWWDTVGFCSLWVSAGALWATGIAWIWGL